MTLLQSMAHMEGYYRQNSRPQRNNNPGDLIWSAESAAFGATHGDPRFAVFPDALTGWNALRRWLSVPARFDAKGDLVGGYLGATIEQAINRFAPPNENDTDTYVNVVCRYTGLKPSSTLTAALLQTPETQL